MDSIEFRRKYEYNLVPTVDDILTDVKEIFKKAAPSGVQIFKIKIMHQIYSTGAPFTS